MTAAGPAAAALPEMRALRILLVEDNPDGRETLTMMLGLRGYDVHALTGYGQEEDRRNAFQAGFD